MLTPATVTLLPTSKPVGFAVVMVMVTVPPLSDALEIALVGPGQTAASPSVQAGGNVPGAHDGIALVVAVKLSVAGLYNSAVCHATCPGGDPAGGVGAVDRNELPVEPPTISTWPSKPVPLPSIMVA